RQSGKEKAAASDTEGNGQREEPTSRPERSDGNKRSGVKWCLSHDRKRANRLVPRFGPPHSAGWRKNTTGGGRRGVRRKGTAKTTAAIAFRNEHRVRAAGLAHGRKEKRG